MKRSTLLACLEVSTFLTTCALWAVAGFSWSEYFHERELAAEVADSDSICCGSAAPGPEYYDFRIADVEDQATAFFDASALYLDTQPVTLPSVPFEADLCGFRGGAR